MNMNKLRQLREAAGLSQTDLAIRSRVAANTISSLENGRVWPYPKWRKRLAAALRVDEAAIFPGYQEQE